MTKNVATYVQETVKDIVKKHKLFKDSGKFHLGKSKTMPLLKWTMNMPNFVDNYEICMLHIYRLPTYITSTLTCFIQTIEQAMYFYNGDVTAGIIIQLVEQFPSTFCGSSKSLGEAFLKL